MGDIKSLILPPLMVFAPIIGFIPQYLDIQKSGNPRGFSTLVCFILLVSNVVRIFYWFGARFELFLLFQSIVMIVAQVVLLSLCVTLRRKIGICGRSNSLFDASSFWNWPYFSTFMQFIGALTVALTLLTVILVDQLWFVEFIGTVALGIEATLALPQAYANWKNRSAEGLNLILIASWFVGDAFKTFVFLNEQAPMQFVACGSFQLFVDFIILIQMLIYRTGPSPQAVLTGRGS